MKKKARNGLRLMRIILATLSIAAITGVFLDHTGLMASWFGWMAKIQFIPAVLALNVGVVIFLIALTLVFGRIYCSVICPLGIMQDVVSWIHSKRKRNRFSYTKPLSWLRYAMLALFVVLMLVGLGSIAGLIAPYSAYGRMVGSLLLPVYEWGNNIAAGIAERYDSYAVYSVDVWVRSIATLSVAVITLVVIVVLAWRGGRTYCNTICPVGTVLGMLSRYSWLRPVIDTSVCNGCGKCGRNCKSQCIDTKNHTIDYSRCVACFDCVKNCSTHAITYSHRRKAKIDATALADAKPTADSSDNGRRTFIATAAAVAATAAVKAEIKNVDGGLAVIEDKVAPNRTTPITPPGSKSARHLYQHCTACQLCISQCPNQVLRPSTDLDHFMQPTMSYERGYCRPECNRCSTVCPTGAISMLDLAEKSSTQIGHAVWIKKNCVVITDEVECGNCARHCPVGAITMINSKAGDEKSLKIPMVDTQRCIGCGACENLCPARPFSAIYVEGNEVHHTN